jgi:hypothetical protein
MMIKLASTGTGTSGDGDASSGISGDKSDWQRWPGGPHALRVECVGDRKQRSATGGPRCEPAPQSKRARRQEAKQQAPGNGARSDEPLKPKPSRKTNKQTNKQTARPETTRLPTSARVGGCVRARVCVFIGGWVRGWAWGACVAESADLRRGALRLLPTIARAHATLTSPDAIGGIRRRRGRILHRHTPRRCACVRARASVRVCARARARERGRERVCVRRCD